MRSITKSPAPQNFIDWYAVNQTVFETWYLDTEKTGDYIWKYMARNPNEILAITEDKDKANIITHIHI